MIINQSSRYLVVPTSQRAEKTSLLIESDVPLLDLDVKVDFAHPETVFYYDLAPFMGLDVKITHKSGKSFGFSESAPARKAHVHRPLLRFTPNLGWINDPNGLIRYEGKYHLFFQHNPVGLAWGNMHWGHAVSTDLINWSELGDVLCPDRLGAIYSGSAIVDADNLLGVKENEHDTLVLFYTAAADAHRLASGNYTQCIAYSTDGGVTFKKWHGNPVVPHIKGSNRDPKVVRDPESGVYVMSLYLDEDEYAVLTSQNLTEWTLVNRFRVPGDNECPDLCPMRDESTGRIRWVFLGAHDCVLVGDFDPIHGFVPSDSFPTKLGFGRPYAAQSFNLGDDLRRVRLSWNRFGTVGGLYTSSMSIPCELTLRSGRVSILPAREVTSALTLTESGENLPFLGFSRRLTRPCMISLTASKFEVEPTIDLFGTEIKLGLNGTLTVEGESMPLPPNDGSYSLVLVYDNSGLEIFDGEGRVFGAFDVYPTSDRLILGGEGSLDKLEIREMI